MAAIRDIIKSIDPVDEKMAEIKEALQLLIELAEEKANTFLSEIQKDLLDGKLNDTTLKVPITRVIGEYKEFRAKTSETTDIVKDIKDAIVTIFDGNGNVANGIADLVNTAITAIMGAGKGEEITKTMYVVVSEYPAIVRYDFAFWNRTIESKGIMEKIENSLACVAVKSAVDIGKLAFNDFLSLYGPILKKAFGNNEQEIKTLLNEAKEIYSMLQENSNTVNTINIDKSLEYIKRIDKADIGNQWYIVRGLKNGKVEIDEDERDMYHNDIVANMSVYAAQIEEEAVKYLRQNRFNSEYGVIQYSKLKSLNNFQIKSDFAGGNERHYLISGITIEEAKNKFSHKGDL